MKKYIAILCLLVTSYSCKDWLSVDSEDRIMEEALYKSEAGFYTALNGIYVDMLNANLYNKTLTTITFDVMAQYYNTNVLNNHTFETLAQYQTQAKKNAVDATWTRAYYLIANANVILEHCQTQNNVLSTDNYNIIKGESLALRALLHFDLFRIFGPIYSESPGAISIPYMDVSNPQVKPLLAANVVVERILQDLTEAEQLLKQSDPVITKGKLISSDTDNAQLKNRNLRLNYFAVKALIARVQLYVGNKTQALKYAEEVIADASAFFPFSTREQVNGQEYSGTVATQCEDRIFSSEVLFAVYNIKRSTDIYETLFSNKLELKNLLTMSDNGYRNLYPEDGDLRTYQWQSMRDIEGYSSHIFVKYQAVTDYGFNYASMIPVLRMSEMYLIAAECATNTTQAFNRLNQLKSARKTSSVSSALEANIEDEYMREFIGEGQLFWYYKRKKAASIPAIYDRTLPDITMAKDYYLFQIPESEQGHRD